MNSIASFSIQERNTHFRLYQDYNKLCPVGQTSISSSNIQFLPIQETYRTYRSIDLVLFSVFVQQRSFVYQIILYYNSMISKVIIIFDIINSLSYKTRLFQINLNISTNKIAFDLSNSDSVFHDMSYLNRLWKLIYFYIGYLYLAYCQ